VLIRETVVTQRKKSKTKSKRGRVNINMLGNSPAAMYGKSLIDPFTCSCCIPDGSTGTGCFSTKNVVQLFTGTGGTCNAFVLNLNPNAEFYADTGSTAATPTFPSATNWTQSAAITTVDNLYGEYRPVSGGFRATYFGPTISDGGTILVGQIDGGLSANTLNGNIITNVARQAQFYKIIPLRNGCEITWRPESQEDVESWSSVINNTKPLGTPLGDPFLFCIVYGAASAQATLTIEYVVNYEGQFSNNTYYPGGISQSGTKVLAEPGWYEKSKNLANSVESILSYVPSVVDAGMKGYQGDYLGALSSLANGLAAPGSMGVVSGGGNGHSTRGWG